MSVDPQRLKQVYLGAAEIPDSAQREAWLAQECGQDLALLAKVQALLKAREGPESFLDRLAPPEAAPPEVIPAPRPVPAATIGERASERPGTVIGPYKLLQQIGEGGMGTVFMAEQTHPVQRKVALKIIKPGMDTRAVIARFEAERQALALMDHPNIAKVHDGGETATGRPFFVMELIKGVPITDYCDANRLTPRARLELFLSVCQAVQHAHQKGIIHRDLKPSNVMVAIYDGKPVPKVIDFGVAKATAQKLTERTIFTEVGQIVGTLEYMAPEQAELNNLDIDTRADIYSLGVLLYELLTGSPPFTAKQLRSAGFEGMLRMIREVEPPKPSTKLSISEQLPTIAANRKLEPKKLTKLVHGELDWMVMKCLEKERGRRYETANGLAMDIQRYLHDEPVVAGRPSAAYRFRKFARRNKLALATSVLIAVALVVAVGALAVSTFLTRRAFEAERTAHQDAEARREEADRNFQTARQAVEDYLTQVSESQLLEAPGLEPLRQQLLETALRYYQRFIEQHAGDPALQADVAAAHLRVAQIMYVNDESTDEWFPHLREGVDLIQQLVDERRDTPEVARRLAGTFKTNSGTLRITHGGVDVRRITSYDQKLAQCLENLVHNHPDIPTLRHDLAGIYVYLADGFGQSLTDTGVAVGIRYADEGIALFEKLAAEYPGEVIYRLGLACAYIARGDCLGSTGRLAEAETAKRKAVDLRREMAAAADGKPSYRGWLAVSYRDVGWVQNERNEPKQAEMTLREALKLQEKLVEEFPFGFEYDLARTKLVLGSVLAKLNRPREAEKAFREALHMFQTLVEKSPGNPVYQRYRFLGAIDLAQSLVSVGETAEAEKVAHEAETLLRQRSPSLGRADLDARDSFSLVYVLVSMDRFEGAAKLYRKVIELHPKYTAVVNNLAWQSAKRAVSRQRNPSEAVALAKRAVDLDPKNGLQWNTLGVAQYRAGDWKTAIAELKKSNGMLTSVDFSFNTFFLAMAHWQLGDKEEARKWYDRAVKWMDKNKPKDEELRRFRAEAAELLDIERQKD
jgi:serine/threonine protein kinase/tetratricopeptide (TPR) repeat protein